VTTHIKPTKLGIFLEQISADRLDVHIKTDIILTKIEKLCNNKANLDVFDFYLIAKSVESQELSIDTIAKVVFEGYENFKSEEMNLEVDEKLSCFGKFISRFLNTKKSISDRFDINQVQLSKLMIKGEDKNVIAVDLYVICNYFNQDFTQVLEKICGHLQLTTPERQEELRRQHQAKLEERKQNRNIAKDSVHRLIQAEYFKEKRTEEDILIKADNEFKRIHKRSYIRDHLNRLSESEGPLNKEIIDGKTYWTGKNSF